MELRASLRRRKPPLPKDTSKDTTPYYYCKNPIVWTHCWEFGNKKTHPKSKPTFNDSQTQIVKQKVASTTTVIFAARRATLWYVKHMSMTVHGLVIAQRTCGRLAVWQTLAVLCSLQSPLQDSVGRNARGPCLWQKISRMCGQQVKEKPHTSTADESSRSFLPICLGKLPKNAANHGWIDANKFRWIHCAPGGNPCAHAVFGAPIGEFWTVQSQGTGENQHACFDNQGKRLLFECVGFAQRKQSPHSILCCLGVSCGLSSHKSKSRVAQMEQFCWQSNSCGAPGQKLSSNQPFNWTGFTWLTKRRGTYKVNLRKMYPAPKAFNDKLRNAQRAKGATLHILAKSKNA